jgi:uncharacterized membrane protein YgcG
VRPGALGLAVAAALALAAGGPARADERILTFHADVTIDVDGAVTVRETLRVRAEGVRIRRGIYRDFPTDYRDRLGRRVRVPFALLAAERDGTAEPWRQERLANGVRTYLGRADVMLAPGLHTYVLVYRTGRQLGFFEAHDELYWNVTGNDWEFPIDAASATVTLPAGVPAAAVTAEAYTGPMGARGRDWRAGRDPQGRATIATTASLPPRAGLTIVVGWPKGHVTPPGLAAQARGLAADNPTLVAGALGLLLLLVYYAVAWLRVGRDPAGGVIIPRFAAPGELSPAAVRYVWRMRFDDRAFAAALISMAVKGYLAISGSAGSGYQLARRAGADPGRLAPGERKAAAALFDGAGTVALTPASHAQVGPARRALQNELAAEYQTLYFRTNRRWLVPGVLVSVLTVLAALWAEGLAGDGRGIVTLFLTVWLTPWMFAVSVLWAKRQWLGAVIFSAGGLFAAGMMLLLGSSAVLALLLLLGGVNALFYHLLRAPTRAGRRLLDEIEGLRMYLSVAERDRLNALHPPEETPATFERFLPYAFALDVDQAWAERFAAVLARDGQPGQAGYSPVWYQGADGRGFQAAALGDSLGGLSGAVAAAASPPGSSSGSSSGGGGGGSSGGGGGGGGGGGW